MTLDFSHYKIKYKIKGGKLFDKKEIKKVFKLLGLNTEKERKEKLHQGIMKSKESEDKSINYIISDNVTNLIGGKEAKDAELE